MGSPDHGQPTYEGVAGVHVQPAVDSAGSRCSGRYQRTSGGRNVRSYSCSATRAPAATFLLTVRGKTRRPPPGGDPEGPQRHRRRAAERGRGSLPRRPEPQCVRSSQRRARAVSCYSSTSGTASPALASFSRTRRCRRRRDSCSAAVTRPCGRPPSGFGDFHLPGPRPGRRSLAWADLQAQVMALDKAADAFTAYAAATINAGRECTASCRTPPGRGCPIQVRSQCRRSWASTCGSTRER